MLVTMLAVDAWVWFPFWLGLGLVFVAERVVSVWKGGWRARLLAAALLPETIFDMYLNIVYVKSVIDIIVGRKATWHHVMHAGAGEQVAR